MNLLIVNTQLVIAILFSLGLGVGVLYLFLREKRRKGVFVTATVKNAKQDEGKESWVVTVFFEYQNEIHNSCLWNVDSEEQAMKFSKGSDIEVEVFESKHGLLVYHNRKEGLLNSLIFGALFWAVLSFFAILVALGKTKHNPNMNVYP